MNDLLCSRFCFADNTVRQHIEDHGKLGRCDFTKRQNVKVVRACDLEDLFRPFLGLYEPYAESNWYVTGANFHETLAECVLLSDWDVLSDRLSDAEQCKLLDAIRCYTPKDGGPPAKDAWAPKTGSMFLLNERDYWRNFAEHLKHKRRFIPGRHTWGFGDPKDWLSPHLPQFEMDVPSGHVFHRARLGARPLANGKREPWPPDQVGAPPPHLATPGRANPRGISYLYTAESERTAIYEIRAALGAFVTVARFRTLVELRLVDLSITKTIKSPIGHDDLAADLASYAMLALLNKELSKPIRPDSQELDYLPTQYLAEVILDAGYDGIRYRSAMHSAGVNVLFFEPTKLQFVPPARVVRVQGQTLRYRQV